MRHSIWLCACACLFWEAAFAQQKQRTFPYKAYVVSEEVYVRSGPGKNYYPTAKLKRGDEVEVHRHDPGGWYAIRPTPGSFSWVSGRYLQKKDKDLAVVTADRVAARVGSELSDIRDVIQVRLERGEVVEIHGEKQFASSSEAGVWYKIAPPSGEFRWIFGKYVDPDYPRDGVRKVAHDDKPSVYPPVVQPIKTPSLPSPTVKAAEQSGPPPETQPQPSVVVSSAPAAEPAEPPPMRRISPEEFREEVAAAEMQLAMMLAEEPTVWEFGELDSKARWLLTQAETAVERGRARLLLERISQASDIKRRTDEINATQLEIERNNRQLAELSQRRASAMRGTDPKGQFDGIGRLTRVVPSKLGAPQYALLDEKGTVRCYVTPAPGVNLRYYEGRKVGINGIRGYIAEQNAQHVTAKHISVLEDRRWR